MEGREFMRKIIIILLMFLFLFWGERGRYGEDK